MLACGLRRSEVADLTVQHFQQRDEHWVIADLIGKAAHIRTVPVPGWVKATIDGWMAAAGITAGPLFRCISRWGTIWGEGITEKVIWHVVKESAAQAGDCQIVASRLSPHVREVVPRRRRRAGTDPVLAGTRFGRDDRTIPGLQAAAARCSERQNRPRAVASTSPLTPFRGM